MTSITSRVNLDPCINVLRTVRDQLDSLSSGILEYRATIVEQAARIAELEDTLEIRNHSIEVYEKAIVPELEQRVRDLKADNWLLENNNLSMHERLTVKSDERLNVSRLASAALSHLHKAMDEEQSVFQTCYITPAVTTAMAFLKPLAGGQHATYKYNGDVESDIEGRPTNWEGVPYAG
jgi:chromosome segregation ATPase